MVCSSISGPLIIRVFTATKTAREGIRVFQQRGSNLVGWSGKPHELVGRHSQSSSLSKIDCDARVGGFATTHQDLASLTHPT